MDADVSGDGSAVRRCCLWSQEKLRRVGVACLAAGLGMMAGSVIGKYQGRMEVQAQGPPVMGGELLTDLVGGEEWGLRLLKGRLLSGDGSVAVAEVVSVVGRLEARQAWVEGVLGALKAEVGRLRRRTEAGGRY